jgi:multidrug resistance protein MdtO
MATRATPLRHPSVRSSVSWVWFREFIRWEVAPYPGRMNTVIRMTITATLAMIVIVTFRIPNAALAGLFSVLLARENLAATWRGGKFIILGFVLASLYTLFGMMLFRGYPSTHFFWVIGSLYLMFFVMRTTTNYAAALAFVIPIGVALPVWDRTLPSELQVEGTLWPIVIIAVGAGATVAVEVVYRIFDSSDPLLTFVDDLLLAVQQVAESFSAHHAPPRKVLDRVLQYQMIGTGRLRVTLQRQGVNPAQRAQRAALISLSGRLIGLAASLGQTPPGSSDDDALRLHALAGRLARIRTDLHESGGISAAPPLIEGQPSSAFPMLQDMEQTVALISEVFQRDEIADDSQKSAIGWRILLVPDAFQNPEYTRFAFAGCMASGLCYVLYNALDWPGISTSVLTCIVTALSTLGGSLQARFLRLSGFVAGGLVLGISAQILILPALDSIFGFALFFAAATGIAAWFATSSPRLSFFGVQVALAFFFINLQDFRIQTDLTIARDKAVGVFLGILAMGFIFDRIMTKSDVEQLRKLLVRNIQLLAQLGVAPVIHPRASGLARIGRLPSQINDSFAGLEAQTEAVLFEFALRHQREGDVAESARIQSAQPSLRSIYLLQLSLLSHRGRRETELTQNQNQELDDFLKEYSDGLAHIAAWIAGKERAPVRLSEESLQQLQKAFEEATSTDARAISNICQRMVSSMLLLQSEY